MTPCYKSIEDSEWVDFDQVTCFVGKNESGKTAFLEAIHRLNPVDNTGQYDHVEEYPRTRLTQYKQRHDQDPDPVASAKFELSKKEIIPIQKQFTDNILESSTAVLTKNYKNETTWRFDINESEAVGYLVNQFEFHNKTEAKLQRAESFEDLETKVQESTSSDDSISDIESEVQDILKERFDKRIGTDHLKESVPSFLYFDDYSIMEGDINIDKIRRKRNKNNLSESDQTFLSLLSVAELDINDIRNISRYESRKAELEAAANYITDQVFEYWSQSDDLQVEFDRDIQEQNNQQNKQNYVLYVRIRSERDRVTLPFGKRSKGFIWFFSFLAYFSDMKDDDDDLILLLDEPGLNLHAKAQNDFLRFINERLAPVHSVVYTTHSPFMLEPRNMDRARLVQYQQGEGTKISEDILGTDSDTIFPLQAALGYDLIQTLLIGPQVLLVEGKSDMIYLQLMSEILDEQERTSLSHQWTPVPVDGADNVPTFVSMFGANDLDIGVLLDDDTRIQQRLENIESRGQLDLDDVKLITEYTANSNADTEDMFSKEFYISLVNDAYLPELRMAQNAPDEVDPSHIQNQNPRIARRLEWFFEEKQINGSVFEHNKPAKHFQKNRDKFKEEITEDTLDRFEALFEDLNSIIDA
ncbi:AAA family ATPase [Natrialba aegyptia]|uniref:Uncharacterized protein n=1 Tax=Natrialba aegyptia DSM 13077 TaxID=1227491 RepID=M0ASA2_9EURY|nr:AAA family ATPase [Natrialba aegyptia]ELZ01571.1 hypothetical protein C480_17897 [Natrialba aegyptia DSM 13077]